MELVTITVGSPPAAGTVKAEQLPDVNLLEYPDLKRAILQRVGHTTEQHGQHFHSLMVSEQRRPFTFTQQLQYTCRRWLLAEEHGTEYTVEQIMLEQFVSQLPQGMA